MLMIGSISDENYIININAVKNYFQIIPYCIIMLKDVNKKELSFIKNLFFIMFKKLFLM